MKWQAIALLALLASAALLAPARWGSLGEGAQLAILILARRLSPDLLRCRAQEVEEEADDELEEVRHPWKCRTAFWARETGGLRQGIGRWSHGSLLPCRTSVPMCWCAG